MASAESSPDTDRFAFGKNWTRYARHIGPERIADAERSLRTMLGVNDLRGRTFLDIGCGSGLFSLAAHRLGAAVTAFDYDPNSVSCSQMLLSREARPEPAWRVGSGSVLDRPFMTSLGTFDVVYSWGVLHHTGAMWDAIDNAASACAPGGALFIAIYNDQGAQSRRWHTVKRTYNRLPRSLRFLVLAPAMVYLWGRPALGDILHGRPFTSLRRYDAGGRGMSLWHDLVDWVGGYPFEVATPEAIFDFLTARGFRLDRLRTCQNVGCNEFVLRRT